MLQNGETALHLATRYAQGQAVLALLELGADPQQQDKHGETPLHIAAWDAQSGLLDLLCRFCAELNFINLVRRAKIFKSFKFHGTSFFSLT